jgi:hypothetical protein
MTTEKIFIWIVGIFTTAFSGLLFIIHISEFINIAILKEIENYPFGCECVNKFSYKSAQHYSIASLLYSITFLATSILSYKVLIKNKIKTILMIFFILVLLFICQFYI